MTCYSVIQRSHVPASEEKAIAYPNLKLGEILVNQRYISSAQLESALVTQFQRTSQLRDLLVEQCLISQSKLENVLQEQYWYT